MACVTRNALKLLQNLPTYSPRTTVLKETHRLYTSVLNTSHRCIMRSLSPPPILIPFQGTRHWRFLHSDGDKDLVNYLGKEIELEEVKVPDLPKIKEFNMKIDGTLVTLERVHETENIRVEFNVRDNVPVPMQDFNNYVADLADCVNFEDQKEMEGVTDVLFEELFEDWTRENNPSRYPVFRVYTQKQSGTTLCFYCSLNTEIDENDAVSERVASVSDDNFLLLEKVEIHSCDGAENTDIRGDPYSGRFDVRPCGGELQALLMNTLLERGIDGDFVNRLAELASVVEQRHYIGFMKSLSKYVSEA